MTKRHNGDSLAERSQRSAKLSDRIYARIFERIVNGDYAEGERLPSESALAEQHKVSRPIVREALLRLREDGLVFSRKGAGSFVERRPDHAMLRYAPLESIADMQRCFEFRTALEGEAARLAAERGSVAEIAAIERAIRLLKERIAARELGVDADFAFHLAISRATGNHFFSDSLLSLKAQITFGQNLARNLGLRNPETRLPEVQAEHEAIYEAIRRHEGDQAQAAMRRHISNSRRRVFEG